MRGRRRGRNRPSPQGSPSQDAAATSSGSSQGSATLVEDPPQVAGSGESDATVVNGPSSDASDKGSAEDSAASGASPVSEGVQPTPDTAADGDPSQTASGESVEETVVPDEPVVDATEARAAPVEVATPDPEAHSSEEAPGQAADGPETPPVPAPAEAADEVVPASTGRVAQAASGNPLPRVLAVANQKGGVGKTTTSVNLGAALAELGFRVLVIDLDPQGNATTGLGIDARNFELSMYDVLMRDCSLEDCVEPTSMKNLFVAPATIALAGAEIELVPAFSRELKLKRAIESVIDDFDYVLIDCPPSLGLITVNALAAATEVLVPIQCEYYALEGLSQLMRNVHLVASNLNPRLDISTIVLTMYDARTKLADQVATEVRDHFGSKVCRIVIPRTVRLSEAPSFGQPITAFDPASRGAIAYRELAKEVSGGTS